LYGICSLGEDSRIQGQQKCNMRNSRCSTGRWRGGGNGRCGLG
jgi:hypothetical protein